MRLLKLAASLAATAAVSFGYCIPKALIIQANADTSPIQLGDALAQALEDEGKVDAIVWSQTDPVFRAAVLDGRVHAGSPNPSADDVTAAEKALGCDYLMQVSVMVKGTALTANVNLSKADQVVWSNSQTVDPGGSKASDVDNAVRSIARTWAIQMSAGPFKPLAAQPAPPQTPSPAPGQAPRQPITSDPVAPQPDSAKALAQYDSLMAANKTAEATTVLREAIDTAPLDPKLRVTFIEHLNKIGRKLEAAAEAARAAALMPDSQELRGLAAQALIDTGQTDQAASQLNEALARDPNDPVTRQMLADMDLRSLKAQDAIEHIDAVMKKSPSKDLAYRRAVADALLGDGTAVDSDLAQAAAAASWTSEEDSYTLGMQVMDTAFGQTVNDMKSLVERATVRRDDPEVAKAIDEQAATLAARQKLLTGWNPPVGHKNSHGKRILAFNLLNQCLSGLKAYLADGSEDTRSDASIDLGEAVKQSTAAREALAAEQGNTAKDGRPPLYSSH